MTNFIFGVVVGLIVGTIITKRLDSSAKADGNDKKKTGGNDKSGAASPFLNQQQIEAKQENLDKIMEVINKSGEITNDQVEFLLGVSDRSTTRYLEELEKQGKIVQVGTTGRSVTYRKK